MRTRALDRRAVFVVIPEQVAGQAVQSAANGVRIDILGVTHFRARLESSNRCNCVRAGHTRGVRAVLSGARRRRGHALHGCGGNDRDRKERTRISLWS